MTRRMIISLAVLLRRRRRGGSSSSSYRTVWLCVCFTILAMALSSPAVLHAHVNRVSESQVVAHQLLLGRSFETQATKDSTRDLAAHGAFVLYPEIVGSRGTIDGAGQRGMEQPALIAVVDAQGGGIRRILQDRLPVNLRYEGNRDRRLSVDFYSGTREALDNGKGNHRTARVQHQAFILDFLPIHDWLGGRLRSLGLWSINGGLLALAAEVHLPTHQGNNRQGQHQKYSEAQRDLLVRGKCHGSSGKFVLAPLAGTNSLAAPSGCQA